MMVDTERWYCLSDSNMLEKILLIASSSLKHFISRRNDEHQAAAFMSFDVLILSFAISSNAAPDAAIFP